MSITEFLLARLAEDEAWAAEVGRGYVAAHGLAAIVDEPRNPGFYARVLAEVEAKRRIIGMEETYEDAYVSAVRHLAAVYADHPDYRDEWRLTD